MTSILLGLASNAAFKLGFVLAKPSGWMMNLAFWLAAKSREWQ